MREYVPAFVLILASILIVPFLIGAIALVAYSI